MILWLYIYIFFYLSLYIIGDKAYLAASTRAVLSAFNWFIFAPTFPILVGRHFSI